MSRFAAHRQRLLIGVLASFALVTGGCAELEQSTAPTDDAPTKAAEQPTRQPASKQKPPRTRAETTVAKGQAESVGRSRKQKPALSHRNLAATQLASLVVAGRAPMTGYDRDRFGQAWLDADRNGCDTRNDMLRRDLQSITLKAGTNGCVVLTGVLADPYTRMRIDFVRGRELLRRHRPRRRARQRLGQRRVAGSTSSKRAALANDPLNLLAVDAGANRSKGDSNAASWLPPNKAYRCAYVARQVAVKAKYAPGRHQLGEGADGAAAGHLPGQAGDPGRHPRPDPGRPEHQ